METKELRQLHAESWRKCGRRAYSDCHNHVIVSIHKREEFGIDLPCAIRLREDLDMAIRNAALSDDEYSGLCG